MKQIVEYECDICLNRHNSKEDAEECEKRHGEIIQTQFHYEKKGFLPNFIVIKVDDCSYYYKLDL